MTTHINIGEDKDGVRAMPAACAAIPSGCSWSFDGNHGWEFGIWLSDGVHKRCKFCCAWDWEIDLTPATSLPNESKSLAGDTYQRPATPQ